METWRQSTKERERGRGSAGPHQRGSGTNLSLRSHRRSRPRSSLSQDWLFAQGSRKQVVQTLEDGGSYQTCAARSPFLPRRSGESKWKKDAGRERSSWGRSGRSVPQPLRRKSRGFGAPGPPPEAGRVGWWSGALQTRRLYANRTERLQLVWPQGAHRPVLTATFPLQGALQTLPVTGREPDTQRSPHTTPPRELLTPAAGRTEISPHVNWSPVARACWPECLPSPDPLLRAPSLHFYSSFPLKHPQCVILLQSNLKHP